MPPSAVNVAKKVTAAPVVSQSEPKLKKQKKVAVEGSEEASPVVAAPKAEAVVVETTEPKAETKGKKGKKTTTPVESARSEEVAAPAVESKKSKKAPKSESKSSTPVPTPSAPSSSAAPMETAADEEEQESIITGESKRMARKRKQAELAADEAGDEAEEGVTGGEEEGAASATPALSAETIATLSSTAAFGKSDGSYKNKTRVLVLSSRGVTARDRHLVQDLQKLMPHHKKDVKLDTKGDVQAVNEIAEIKSCNYAIYLDCRKRRDLYMWVSKCNTGPSVKFLVSNVHTMDELRLTGNCMQGSRPLLSFDAGFDSAPHFSVMRSLLSQVFGTPRGHPKSKPFIDHVMSFFIADGNIWVRHYQIMEGGKTANYDLDTAERKLKEESMSLVEIGPRFVLIPIRVFSGSLGGATLFQNPKYVSPNEQRAQFKSQKGGEYANRVKANAAKKERAIKYVLPKDPVDEVFRS